MTNTIEQDQVNRTYSNLIKDLENEQYDDIVIWLYDIGRRYPEITAPIYDHQRRIMRQNKSEIIRSMLQAIKDPIAVDHWDENELSDMIDGARKIGLDWPELDIMERSIRSQLNTVDEASNFAKPDPLLKMLEDYLKHGTISSAAELLQRHDLKVQHNPELTKLLFAYRDVIKRSIARNIQQQYYGAALEIATNILSTGINWPWLRDMVAAVPKEDIIRKLLTRIREPGMFGGSDYSFVRHAIKHINRFGYDWPELDIIMKSLRTAEQQLTEYEYDDQEEDDSSVDESRDDYTPGTESLLRYLRQDLDRGDYDAAMEMIGELAWPTHASMDLSALLNPHKTGLMRAMLTTMSTNDSEGVLYIMPQYLGGLEKFGVHWPEFETIERSIAVMARQEHQSDVMEETFNPYAKQDAESAARQISAALHRHSKRDDRYRAMHAIDWDAMVYDMRRGHMDLIKPILDHNKRMIIGDLLRKIKMDPTDTFPVQHTLDALDYANVQWPELDIIKRSFSADAEKKQHMNETKRFDHEEYVASILEMIREDLVRQNAFRAVDNLSKLYHLDGLSQSEEQMLDRIRDGELKPIVIYKLLKSLKDGNESLAKDFYNDVVRLDPDWPELDVIDKALRPNDYNNIDESWTKKYKRSINCSHPKGFSQKAHCAARRKRRAGGKTKSKSVSEAIRGQQRFIQSTADRLKDDLERGDWTSANYTVQRLNQTDPQEVQAIFEPLAPLFAKMINADPMGTLNYMNRIMSYVDHAYPEVTAAYDENKTEIMQDLLKMVRSGDHGDWVRQQIYQLRNCGVDWPEFNVITRSLLESQDTTQPDQLGTEGREMVLDIFRRKLADGGKRGIYYVMYHMDDWGLKLSDWPELAEMIQDHKREIVTELLKTVKGDFGNNTAENRTSARFTIDRLRRIGMDWPELAVISRSMDADDQLKEEFGHFEEIAEVIASHMYDMAAFLAEGEDQWLVGALSDLYTTLENENLDQQYWPNPEDYDIDVDAHKINFVKGILGAIKQGEGDEAVNAVHMLKDYWHVRWPELDIILKSANADQTKQLDELTGYRADPVYAASQKELAPSKMKTASERDMAMEKLTDYLETQGFKHIGQGSFSEIYLKQGYPWMFKLWSHDPAYLWWITWAAKHQDNPNVPRVKGLPVRIAKDTYVVRLEKLRGLVRREGNLSRGYDRLAYLVDRIESVDDLSKEDLQWIRSEYPGVYDILRVIQRAGSDFVVDLHGDNIMLRGQTPVITDPVVG